MSNSFFVIKHKHKIQVQDKSNYVFIGDVCTLDDSSVNLPGDIFIQERHIAKVFLVQNYKHTFITMMWDNIEHQVSDYSVRDDIAPFFVVSYPRHDSKGKVFNFINYLRNSGKVL